MAPFDLLVIGGGITGAAVARLAARNGWSVALLERADLASGASSNTSHMLHGGLRYLEHGQFTLVREALRERATVSRLAPELAQPTRFLIPFYRHDRRPRWMVRLGLGLYDAFAGRANLARHTVVSAREALALEPELESRGLLGAGLYSDAVMDDARLTVAVARDAAHHGASIHTYTEVQGARPIEGGLIEVLSRDVLDGDERRFVARVIVNASGSWVDRVRARLARSLVPGSADLAPVLRPSRGVHLVLPAITRGHGLLLFANDGRVFFTIPFAGAALVGTTETEVPSPPKSADYGPTVEEVRYLRAALARALPSRAGSAVLAVTSGVRPLLAADSDVGGASREHRVFEDGPVISIAGGKYTTFRVMARHAFERASVRLGRAGKRTRDPLDPLPRPLGPGHDVEPLAEFAVDSEFARRIDDVVRRRTRLWLTPDRGRVAAPRIGAVLARKLGWSVERQQEDLAAFHATLDEEERLLIHAREDG